MGLWKIASLKLCNSFEQLAYNKKKVYRCHNTPIWVLKHSNLLLDIGLRDGSFILDLYNSGFSCVKYFPDWLTQFQKSKVKKKSKIPEKRNSFDKYKMVYQGQINYNSLSKRFHRLRWIGGLT